MKLGIVFEGGASRGLFSCGVMDALLEEKIFADYVVGVSAGIAYGTTYVSGQIGRNLELSTKYMHDKRYMGFHHLLNPKKRSYYNMDFAFREIPETLVPYDFEAFRQNPAKSVATLTNMHTGKPEYIVLPKEDREKHLQILWASCALPFLFQPVDIDGVLYMDGGISDPIPFRRAIDEGCDKIITVLTRERNYSKGIETGAKIAKLAFRKFPDFAKALGMRSEKYNQSRREIFELTAKGQLLTIMPHDTSGFKRTERDPEKLRLMYEDGYKTTKAMMPEIKEYLNI